MGKDIRHTGADVIAIDQGAMADPHSRYITNVVERVPGGKMSGILLSEQRV